MSASCAAEEEARLAAEAAAKAEEEAQQTAAAALEEAATEMAMEVVAEVESEGYLDPLRMEARRLTSLHGRAGILTIVEFNSMIAALDKSEGLPVRAPNDCMKLFSMMDARRRGKLDADDVAKLLNKVYKRKKAASKLDVAGEARELLQTHGRADGTCSLMEFMDLVEAVDEAEGLPQRKRGEVMSLFSDAKAGGEICGEEQVIRLLVTTYGRTQVL